MPELTCRNHIFCVCSVPKVSKVSKQLIELNVGLSILFFMNILHLALSATAVSNNLSHISCLHVSIQGNFRRLPGMAPQVSVLLLCLPPRMCPDPPGGRNMLQPSTDTNSVCRITAILISHFLLELQEVNHMVVKLDADDPLHSSRNPWDSTPSFISSLGGFINPSRSEQSNDDGGIELQVRSSSEAPGEEEGEVLAEVPEAIASSSSTA